MPKHFNLKKNNTRIILQKYTFYLTCISSRITTGIHLKNNFNDTITVIMSRLQSNVTKNKAFIHAWLNLKDKCMTTGRINQIELIECQRSFIKQWTSRRQILTFFEFPHSKMYLIKMIVNMSKYLDVVMHQTICGSFWILEFFFVLKSNLSKFTEKYFNIQEKSRQV